ncbi:MAG: hypothetical protein JXR68_09530 [Bacteroidales bacterium]|nr:hypothetical protein [Bacteroidales bacterium]
MKLDEAKINFIKSWGSLGTKWGINKTLAQIHALFLIEDKQLSADEIMDILKISRGNTNMNVRILMDWGLVYKEHNLGERKEFFVGEKDLWTVFKRVIKYRKEKEFDPMLEVVKTYKNVEGNTPEAIKFKNQLERIEKFANEADSLLEKFSKMDESWFWNKFLKMMT